MFLPTFAALRIHLLHNTFIECLVHLANNVMGIAFGTAAVSWRVLSEPSFRGSFSYVAYENIGRNCAPKQFPVRNDRLTTATARDFERVPEHPIAYWLTDTFRAIFTKGQSLDTSFQEKMY